MLPLYFMAADTLISNSRYLILSYHLPATAIITILFRNIIIRHIIPTILMRICHVSA